MEAALLTGALEQKNEPHAFVKIAGLKLCEDSRRLRGLDRRSVMPNNICGPDENYYRERSHTIPVSLRRFDDVGKSDACQVGIWGTQTPRRKFHHVDDMTKASVHVMEFDLADCQKATAPMPSRIDVGASDDCFIKKLAGTIAEITGFPGRLVWDSGKSDVVPREPMDVSRLTGSGWTARIRPVKGLCHAYASSCVIGGHVAPIEPKRWSVSVYGPRAGLRCDPSRTERSEFPGRSHAVIGVQ